MLCKKPLTIKGSIRPCGQCLPCTINARRVWAHRLMLEADCHEHKAFFTLTHSDENLPYELDRAFLLEWIKNFREKYRYHSGRSLRIYAVGEYGGKKFGNKKSKREVNPHYHAIVYGYPPCENPYRKKWLRKQKKGCDCDPCAFLQENWKLGFTDVGTCSLKSTQYVCGYVTKKLTKKDAKKLEGRAPEFCLNRARPGFGHLAVDFIVDAISNPETGEVFLDENFDIPSTLKRDGKILPLGRYLKKKIREKLELGDEVSKNSDQKWQKEMQDMYHSSIYVEDETKILGRRRVENAPNTINEFLVQKGAGKIAKLEKAERNYQLKKEL